MAIQYDRVERQHRAEISELDCRYRRLTPREREVMELVVSGLLNKQIAYELHASEITIKVHRARIMQKMQAGSLADLVRTSEKLRIQRRFQQYRSNGPEIARRLMYSAAAYTEVYGVAALSSVKKIHVRTLLPMCVIDCVCHRTAKLVDQTIYQAPAP